MREGVGLHEDFVFTSSFRPREEQQESRQARFEARWRRSGEAPPRPERRRATGPADGRTAAEGDPSSSSVECPVAGSSAVTVGVGDGSSTAVRTDPQELGVSRLDETATGSRRRGRGPKGRSGRPLGVKTTIGTRKKITNKGARSHHYPSGNKLYKIQLTNANDKRHINLAIKNYIQIKFTRVLFLAA